MRSLTRSQVRAGWYKSGYEQQDMETGRDYSLSEHAAGGAASVFLSGRAGICPLRDAPQSDAGGSGAGGILSSF